MAWTCSSNKYEYLDYGLNFRLYIIMNNLFDVGLYNVGSYIWCNARFDSVCILFSLFLKYFNLSSTLCMG